MGGNAAANLKSLSFERLTTWELRQDRIKPATCDWDTCAGWIYAFVIDGVVRYVGVATTVLRGRLDGYSYHLNDVVGGRLRQALDAGALVEIYGLRRPGIEKRALEAEESKLIRTFAADWNVRR